MKLSQYIHAFLVKKNATFSFLLLFFISYSFSQNIGGEVGFYFETDTVTVAPGSTFTNFLMLQNLTNQTLLIDSISTSSLYPGLLLLSKTPSTISPGNSERLFVKFIANGDFMKMQSDTISFNLSYALAEGRHESRKATFYRKRKVEEDIFVYPLTFENYVDPVAAESNISIFVENMGYGSRSVAIEFESNFAGLNVQTKKYIVNLEGKEKQIVDLKVSIRQHNSYLPNYNIQIKVIDLKNNKVINTNNLKVVVLSNKTKVSQNTQMTNDKNSMELGYNRSNTGFDYTQFKANVDLNLGNGIRSTFNTAIDYYSNEDAYSIYNTFIDLERKGSSLRLGTIYGTEYDFSVSGRGLKAIGNLGSNRSLEALIIDNSYNLYSNYISQTQSATSAGVKYRFGDLTKYSGTVSYLFDHNPQLSIDSQVAYYSSTFKISETHNFRVESGLSSEKGLNSKREKAGFMSSINYDYKNNRWELSSLNSFASNHYAGMNRGTFNIYQNLGYRISEREQFFLNYQNSQSQPEYMYHESYNGQDDLNIYNFYSTHSIKSGFQISKKGWNYTFSPQIERQKNLNNYIDESLLSYRFRTAVSAGFRAHKVNIFAEYSYSESAKKLNTFSSFKSMLSYSYKSLSLNGTVQYNPNTIYDLNYFPQSSRNFVNYSIYSSYNFKALRGQINGYLSAGLNHSELYKNLNENINATAEYRIAQTWAGTAYVNYSNYESLLTNSFKGENYQFRIGVKKYFSDVITGGYHTVKLQFYQDKNLNGMFDSDEIVMANEVIKLENYIAKTDRKGKVGFSNVPSGTYKLRVNESRGVRLMSDPTIVVSKSLNLQMGLGRNNKIVGKLIEVKQTYDDLESDVRGIIVYAENEEGETTYTVVDQNDEFEFFLKNGAYRIFIENSKYDYLKPSQIIELNNSDYTETIIFKYVKKDRQIKVKKF